MERYLGLKTGGYRSDGKIGEPQFLRFLFAANAEKYFPDGRYWVIFRSKANELFSLLGFVKATSFKFRRRHMLTQLENCNFKETILSTKKKKKNFTWNEKRLAQLIKALDVAARQLASSTQSAKLLLYS